MSEKLIRAGAVMLVAVALATATLTPPASATAPVRRDACTRTRATTQTTCRSTRGRAVNRIPTCARRRGRLRTPTVGDRSSSRSVRTSHCWGTGHSRSVWTPAVVRTPMPRWGSMTRVSVRPDAACDSLQRGRDARVNSFSPNSAIEPHVGYRSGGCIQPSGSAGDSFPPKALRRGRSPA